MRITTAVPKRLERGIMSIRKILLAIVVTITCLGSSGIIYAEYEDSSTMIKFVQELLNEFGYDCGTADGIVGEKTRDAIRRYEQDNGMSVTGSVNDNVLDNLIGKKYVNGISIEEFVERYNLSVEIYNDKFDENIQRIVYQDNKLILNGPGEYEFSIENGNVIGLGFSYENIADNAYAIAGETSSAFFALDPTLDSIDEASAVGKNIIDNEEGYQTPCVKYTAVNLSSIKTLMYTANYEVKIEENKNSVSTENMSDDSMVLAPG